MKRYILLSALILGALTTYAQNWKDFRFESGDLLFQDLDCGELCEALRDITPAINNKHFTHVGLVYVVKDSVYVIEALGEQVQLIPLYQFMSRQLTAGGAPKVVVGRITAEYQNLAGRAVGFALEQRGKPYDNEFTYDNGKYYSSELIFDSYKAAFHGRALFEVQQMSFSDPKTWKIHPTWDRYFKELNVKPPEGKDGFNPSALANDDNVEIITSFY